MCGILPLLPPSHLSTHFFYLDRSPFIQQKTELSVLRDKQRACALVQRGRLLPWAIYVPQQDWEAFLLRSLIIKATYLAAICSFPGSLCTLAYKHSSMQCLSLLPLTLSYAGLQAGNAQQQWTGRNKKITHNHKSWNIWQRLTP